MRKLIGNALWRYSPNGQGYIGNALWRYSPNGQGYIRAILALTLRASLLRADVQIRS